MKNIKVKHMAIILSAVFAVSLIPMLVIGIYNYPCADDYSYAAATRQVWLSSHSVFQVFREAVVTTLSRYQTWQGTYTSIFFMALQPAVWNEKAYAITPFIMTGSLIISTFYLIRVLVVRGLKGTKSESTVLSLLSLFAVIQCMTDKTDAFYWFNGSVHYIIPFALMLVMLGLLITYLLRTDKKRYQALIVASVCAFFVGGGNFVSGLMASVISVSLILLLILTKKFKEQRAVCIPVVLYLIFFIINMAAPGNSVRGETVYGMDPVKSVLVSFRYTLAYCIGEWLDFTIILLLLFAVPVMWKLVKNSAFQFRYPILVAAYSYCLLSSSFTPGLYAAGNVNAGRIQNIIYALFVLLLFINVTYTLGWICRHFAVPPEKEEARHFFTTNESLSIAASALMLLFCIAITVKPNPEYYTSTAAITELVSGEASAYGREMEYRTRALHSADPHIVIPRIIHQPDLIYHSDITTDPNDWTNRAMCKYYGKETIVLSQ